MSDNFNEQKDLLLSIKHEINLLHQQVDFLLRNEKAVGLLDLDVMMNRTHTIYDQMCSINLGEYPTEENEEELPVEPQVIHSLFGLEEEEETASKEEPIPEEEPIEEEEEQPIEEEEELPIEENEDAYFEEEVEEEEEQPVKEEVEEPIKEEPVEEEPAKEEEPKEELKDDFGFILNFEPTDNEPEPTYTTGDEIEMSVPQSLADKLQHDSLGDLRSAIGINDKFLFVNELFGGNMEKYNKSIDNLNDLKTLNGALVYMNELRIELQWNSSNEAYQRLLDLVHHKFE